MILFSNLSYISHRNPRLFQIACTAIKEKKVEETDPTASGHRIRSEILSNFFDLLEGRPLGVVLWTSTSWHIF